MRAQGQRGVVDYTLIVNVCRMHASAYILTLALVSRRRLFLRIFLTAGQFPVKHCDAALAAWLHLKYATMDYFIPCELRATSGIHFHIPHGFSRLCYPRAWLCQCRLKYAKHLNPRAISRTLAHRRNSSVVCSNTRACRQVQRFLGRCSAT